MVSQDERILIGASSPIFHRNLCHEATVRAAAGSPAAASSASECSLKPLEFIIHPSAASLHVFASDVDSLGVSYFSKYMNYTPTL